MGNGHHRPDPPRPTEADQWIRDADGRRQRLTDVIRREPRR
jgi:hypothetical protein